MEIEFFEHTADIGMRVRAADLDALFAEAAKGFLSLIVENAQDIQPRETLEISLDARELQDLFFDWLSELLYCFEVRRLVLCRFDVHVTGTNLRATVFGEKFSTARHAVAHEVKAVTYHQLKVQETPEGWLAEVILDI